MAITLLGPSPIPFPNAQNLSADITVNNPTATIFTINTSGRYLITYQVYPTLSLLTTFQLFRTGAGVAGTNITAAIGLSLVSNQVIININAGDTIQVMVSATLAATVSLAAGTTAATISIVRVG
ncbi:hypothetical protein [Bacillus sp. FJAT-25509]|uniref:BclA C-terminal domain-containing protein n=1 Tax=Bacillus sp. FJAT-25509 TaxID=1712029 RepID=UPI00256FF51A|nr:hypothetical protein [Bacillus sp. FJAT-25509]